MNSTRRTPPNLKKPPSSRWKAVIKIDLATEIWFLDLRQARPGFFFAVMCDVKSGHAVARYEIPEATQLVSGARYLMSDWGHRFFWSSKRESLIVQTLHTFEYSERTEIEQLTLLWSKTPLAPEAPGQPLQLLPNDQFHEVFPAMIPE